MMDPNIVMLDLTEATLDDPDADPLVVALVRPALARHRELVEKSNAFDPLILAQADLVDAGDESAGPEAERLLAEKQAVVADMAANRARIAGLLERLRPGTEARH